MGQESVASGVEVMGSPTKALVTGKVDSPLATRLRPDAQVFVPSVQKEAPTPSTSASSFGVAAGSGGHKIEALQSTSLKAVREHPFEHDGQAPQKEVNRALFH